MFWGYKKAQFGMLGWDKVRFKVLHFLRFYNFTFFIHPASFTLVRYDKVLESKKVTWIQDDWSISRKAVHRQTATRYFVIWWKSCIPYCLYWQHPSKKVHAFQKFYVRVDNICGNKLWRNAEERFYLETLSWGQRSGNKNKPPFNDL